MASRRWHNMNNTVCEIIRSTELIEKAMCHCMTHKNSAVKELIHGLSEKREKLYNDLTRQCEEWIAKLDSNSAGDVPRGCGGRCNDNNDIRFSRKRISGPMPSQSTG